jgi:hypothetical protein
MYYLSHHNHWTNVQEHIIIIACCYPMIRPLVRLQIALRDFNYVTGPPLFDELQAMLRIRALPHVQM